jgi:hypothetical protein
MTSEANFMSYFLKQVPHGYRTEVIGNPGFPDCLLISGTEHYFVELKILKIGPSGDRKLRSVFKKTQRPWYHQYLAKGGCRLFVVFHLGDRYGILRITQAFLDAFDVVRYRELKDRYIYKEYGILKELILDNFGG